MMTLMTNEVSQGYALFRIDELPCEQDIRVCSFAVPVVSPPNEKLIWCDPVNIFELLGWFLYLSFRGQGQQQPWQVMATIDQADIRGSEPHNHDPSGAASDYSRESG
jgi:hypothetical protein